MENLNLFRGCPCCGSTKTTSNKVLWEALINEWQLSNHEVEYIDRQQGIRCEECQSNLRSMALAVAIMKCFGYEGLFQNFVNQAQAQKLAILEVNEAGNLTSFLSQIPGHVLKSYPEIDITHLPFADDSFDLIVHSDTLEHVKHPVRALSECYRCLKPGSFLAYTIPMIVDRLTLSRAGLPPSYHAGSEDLSSVTVHTEYGCDAWKQVIQAGFGECRICSLEYPAAQALVGVKMVSAYVDNATVQLKAVEAGLHMRLQQTQAELQQSQAHLGQTQAELQQSQAHLGQTQAELQQTQVELERSHSQLHQNQTEKQQLQAKLEQLQAQVKQTQIELGRSHTTIKGIKSSKFWKLRTAWFNTKRAIGLSVTQSAQASDIITIPGVNHISEISFKATKNSPNGFFDGINGANTDTIVVPPQPTLLTVSGWAIIADEERAADSVIISYCKQNIIVAVATVNLSRPDVVKALKNPAYINCGWRATLNSANLPDGRLKLRAWAYNAATKEAIQLNLTNSGSKLSDAVARLKYVYAVFKAKGMGYAVTKLSQKVTNKLNNSPLAVELLPGVFQSHDPYHRWLEKNFPRAADLQRMAETTELLGYKPVISVIMPVFNTPEQFLRAAIESVLQQVYPYWELCIADDASTQLHVRTVLEEYLDKDTRIKVVFRSENGHISLASNSALEIAKGEFVALLDHDDLVTPNALYEVALLLNRHPDADMIYSDEDKIDEHLQYKDPFFKPEWCPDSFLSRMYTCHLGTYRRSLIEQIGGFRAGYEGSQDYDLVLRVTEKTENIYHIPKILYHWRIHSDSTAAGTAGVKNYAYEAAEKAIAEALARRSEKGKVTTVPSFPGNYIVRYEITDYKLVSIIIPTKDLGDILHKCLESIFSRSIYPNYEVIVIDNGSKEAKTAKILADWAEREPNRFRYYPLDIPFNYSQINNYGVSQAKGDYLLFLNNDTEVITPDWINALVEQAQRSSIGAVGALLLYPDDTIQHAGIVLGLGGVAAHSHRHFPAIAPGYFCQINTINNFSAVTGACLMCRREVYQQVGGFDEKLVVAYNDVDLCLKLVERGYRNLYSPYAVLYHYESKSRGYEDTPEKVQRLYQEANYLRSKWQKIMDNDPCYSPHLTRDREDYSINI